MPLSLSRDSFVSQATYRRVNSVGNLYMYLVIEIRACASYVTCQPILMMS